ncbi:hypothetical protein CPLU01_06301 [Colletotrichum plurivorum]|uniref:Uncharacterized protein n=1 Tax=Colletotrichum plurivorum TaxID=2175906 RepID=A0A8H6NG02_9PEZI|nr:hypothetical protein CPLU01_06301 [Colletotrichum plurivorum]
MSDYSEQFVASIASALNSSQIPCVLWGHCLLSVHGIPSIVAPANKLWKSYPGSPHVPTQKHASPAPRTGPRHRRIPPPHHRLRAHRRPVPTVRDATVPADPRRLPRPPFLLASDRSSLPPWRPGRSSGVFESGGQPMVVPKAHVLLEAFLRLYVRDAGRRVGAFAMPMIGYVETYVDGDGLLDVGELPEPLRSSYAELRLGEKPLRQWRSELQRALETSGDEVGW